MKASNILLTSLVGSITLTIMAIMADIRFSGTRGGYTEYDSTRINVPAFSHLVISDIERSIPIESSPGYSITLRTIKGQQMPTLNYRTAGDTLYISQFENHDQAGAYVVVQVPHGALNDVSANNSEIILNNYSFTQLSVVLQRARLQLYPRDELHPQSLTISGSDQSKVNASSLSLDTLDINLNNSFATFNGTVQLLKGSMQNKSSLGVREINNFQFKKDASSQLDHWE